MEKQNEGKPHSAKFLRQRKFLLVLPLLTLPFVILLAWTLGIVGEAKASTAKEQPYQGLNLTLPNAAPARDSNWNKLQYYIQADKDSAKLRAMLKSDPYRNMELETGDEETVLEEKRHGGYHYSYDPHPATGRSKKGGRTVDAEERVYEKLAELDKQLKAAEQPAPTTTNPPKVISTSVPSGEVDRLEKLMQTLHQGKDTGSDPEMDQLAGMLNTILDIQHPERVQQKIREQSEQHKRQVFAVEQKGEDIISTLESTKDFSAMLQELESDSMPVAIKSFMESNQFYGLDEIQNDADKQHAIPRVVHEDQTLVSGATVKLRLLEDVFIAGIRVPKDQFVYGLASLHGERLQVSVTSISYQHHILPVALSVYDRDGIAGINIPGAITRDVAKRSAAQSMQGLGSVNTLNPSAGAQAVTAGLQMAQNLVGKTAKLVRVSVKAGYQVLLKDDNVKD